MARTALLLGASGLIGGHCLRLLLQDESYDEVLVLVRPNELKEKWDGHRLRANEATNISGIKTIVWLDVLDGLETLMLCTGYELDGETIDILPMGADDIARCKPIYETLPGWSDTTVGVTELAKLPQAARRYLERIEQVTGVPIAMVSTSPDRDHTIMLQHPFEVQ